MKKDRTTKQMDIFFDDLINETKEEYLEFIGVRNMWDINPDTSIAVIEIEETVMQDLIEKVARGLRAVNKKPDAFLYVSHHEFTWDEPLIMGIPVFHSSFIVNTSTDDDIPFIPLWKNESDYTLTRKKFNDGFMEEI